MPLPTRADAVAARHGAGANTVVGMRESVACPNYSSGLSQPPTPPARALAPRGSPAPDTPNTANPAARQAQPGVGDCWGAAEGRAYGQRAARSAAGRRTEYHRALGAFSARPIQYQSALGCACRAARQRLRKGWGWGWGTRNSASGSVEPQHCAATGQTACRCMTASSDGPGGARTERRPSRPRTTRCGVRRPGALRCRQPVCPTRRTLRDHPCAAGASRP